MSGNYTNTDGRSDSLNATSAHDTGLYDPARHDNQIVAVYETNQQAHAAHQALKAAGVSDSAIRVLEQSGTTAASTVESDDQGFWGAIKSLFAPDDDMTAYSHALKHGHAMLVVTPDSTTDRSRVIQVLESTDPIDFDAKLEEWRQAGYDYSSRPDTGTALGAAAGVVPTAATTSRTDFGTRPATGATPDLGYRSGAAATNTGDTESLKVMEERLRVGKREVAQGAVRVRSYVVERPVEEQVRLHEERITIERKPVDRPATPGDVGAFQERTIEARATSEEAVVSKEARVVEEIGIRKDATERTETVRDTVRRTEVDVEDTTAKGAKLGGGATTSRPTTPATPNATTSGANTPRK